ncbi:MAG: hypothetical protein KA113_12110 [Syntrophaceae bacterium]|nr:hypothetical protein [Syntrophaceae bacterium]
MVLHDGFPYFKPSVRTAPEGSLPLNERRIFFNATFGTLLPLNSKVGLKLQDWKNRRACLRKALDKRGPLV